MSTGENRLKELRTLLTKCNDFINNYEQRTKRDIAESQKYYQTTYNRLKHVQAKCDYEYRKQLAVAIQKGYGPQQLENLKEVWYNQPIETAKNECDGALEILHELEGKMETYPIRLQSALNDRAKILAEVQSLERQLYGRVITSSAGQNNTQQEATFGSKVAGFVFVVVLLLLLKSCFGG